MTDEELIEYTNKAIAELVYPKSDLQKAYNYYNGIRDKDQFKYLEENYGIGNPTSVKFIPLIKKHIDALVGEYLGTPITPKVTCKDQDTISQITREKQLTIFQQLLSYLNGRLKSRVLESLQTGQQLVEDPAVKQDINNYVDDLNYGFQSQYEVAATNVIQYLLQSRETDFKNKLKQLLLDLLITGYTFFRARPTAGNNNVKIEVLSPLNTFPDRNFESPYIKDSYRIVVRKWMTQNQILNIYGDKLSNEDKALLKETWKDSFNSTSEYVRSYRGADGTPATEGLRAGQEVTIPGYPSGSGSYYNHDLIPVYEVEWLKTDKDNVLQRYKTIRIGEEIYILIGLDEDVIRSKDNPRYCSLSVNGVYFTNRGTEPYSMVLACADLQDKYDLLHFFRDNLIANAGSTGDWVDVSMLPSFLGDKLSERLQKWIAYKKTGIALLDTSQEGRLGQGASPINTIYNGYDDTVKAQAVQAIQIIIDATEQTCSSITGVFRERLNGIQQKDAVTNVQTSVNNSYTISKQWYQQMDTITEEILLDSLNVAKIVYKNGLTGTLILGDKEQKIFTALPEYFTMSDYDIHITSSSDISRDIEQLRALVPEFIKSGLLDPECIIEVATTKSVTELKMYIHNALRKQKQENDKLSQAMQQIQQLQQQIQQLQQENQQVTAKLQQVDEAKLQLEKYSTEQKAQIDMFKAQTDRQYRESVEDNDTKRTQIQLDQLHDNDPHDDNVRQMRN